VVLHRALGFDANHWGWRLFFISQDIVVPGRPLAYCSGRFYFESEKIFAGNRSLCDRMTIVLLPM
jgi:hypothetical protein